MVKEFKGNITKIENLDAMPVPETVIKREKGVELLVGFLASQKQSPEDNEEAMEWISLTYTHPEYKDEILNKIKKHKPFIKNSEELYEKTINSLKEYEKNSPLLDLDEEIKKREKMLPRYKEQVIKSIGYFRPNIKTSNIKQVGIIPCDKLLPRVNTGRSIDIGNIIFIMSHTENPDNFDHEFLHGLINPITEKFTEYFESDEQKDKILKFTNGGIEGYGGYPVSILNEEIIQTYNLYIKNKRDISMIKTELRKRLFSFLKEYENSKIANNSLSFEKYFSDNFKKILA